MTTSTESSNEHRAEQIGCGCQFKGTEPQGIPLESSSVSSVSSFGPKLTPPPLAPESPHQSGSSLHLWELPSKYLCAIVGTCATIPEIRKLAVKSRIDNPAQYTDYQLHNIFVNAAHDGTRPGRLLEKLFQQKFRSTITLYRHKNTSEFETLWGNSLHGGDVAGSYYVLLTSTRTPPSVRDKAVGEIHMLSHISGMSCRVDLKNLPKLKKENRELSLQVEKLNLKYVRLVQTSEKKEAGLEKSLLELKSQLQGRIAEDEALGDIERSELRRLRDKNKVLSGLIDKQRKERSELQREIYDINRVHPESQEQTSATTSGDLVGETVDARLSDQDQRAGEDPTDSVPGTDLAGKKVLYVGGRFRQAPHFRDLVEKLNGFLFFHDGGREDGARRLDELLPRADVVVCPIDCISHGATDKIKRECQKLNIRFLPVRRSSLSSLARALGNAYS